MCGVGRRHLRRHDSLGRNRAHRCVHVHAIAFCTCTWMEGHKSLAPMHMCHGHGTMWCSIRPQSLQCQEAPRGAQPRMDDAVSRARAMTSEQSISMCARSNVDARMQARGARRYNTVAGSDKHSGCYRRVASSRIESKSSQVKTRQVTSGQVR